MARALATVFASSDYRLVQTDTKHDEDNLELLTSEVSVLNVHDQEENPSSSGRGSKSGTCLACGISSFESLAEQREHFKADWHRYNVKLRVLGRANVSEDEFNAMVEGDDDVGSISGSDDGSDEDEAGQVSGNMRGELSPYYIFNVQDRENGGTAHIGIWKCLLVPDDKKRMHREDAQQAFEKLLSFNSITQQWAVLMLQGGHFAGCIYTIRQGQCEGKAVHEAAESCITEIKHKSFHRYVVRAKAGGKQSDKDATGKYAKSAGSRLRRYNEAVLQKEIVETLEEWHDLLSECSLIFVSTPGSNRLVLFGGDSPPLDKKDERIRKIPFITRRPTMSETKRVVRTLLTMYSFELSSATTSAVSKKDTETTFQRNEQRQQAEDKRVAAKLELQRQEELGKERNRKKKQRQKEQKRRLKMQEHHNVDDEQHDEQHGIEEESHGEIDLEAELKSLAASVVAPRSKPVPVKKEPKARSKISSEDLASRREKMAAAAEARAKALAAASSTQKFYQ